RKCLPIGKRADGKRGREPCHFLRKTGGGERVGADDGEHSMLAPRGESDLRKGERVGGSRKGRKHQPPAALRQNGRERRQRRKRICGRLLVGDGYAGYRERRCGGRRRIGRGRRHAKSANAMIREREL